MERRKSSSCHGAAPPVAAAAVAADALRLCTSIRAAAADVPTCRRDCRRLARFVGKVMLILEGLQPAMEEQQRKLQAAADKAAAAAAVAAPSGAVQQHADGSGSGDVAAAWRSAVQQQRQLQQQGGCAPDGATQRPTAQPAAGSQQEKLSPRSLMAAWAEAARDVQEALQAVADLVAACSAMGRLQAVLEAEEMRSRFLAAARDLGMALSGLVPLQEAAPQDVGEDLAAVQRQLTALRFTSSSQADALGACLLQAVALLYARQCDGAATVAPLLAAGLALAGLDPSPGKRAAWLDFEVSRLRDGARLAAQEGDSITEFFYKQVIMCLLAHVCGAWSSPHQQQQLQLIKEAEAAAAASELAAVQLDREGSSSSSLPGVGTPPVAASTPQKCVSDVSSRLQGAFAHDFSAASLGVATAAEQQPLGLGARLQQLMNAWAGEGCASAPGSAQPSPGGSSSGQEQQAHRVLLPVGSLDMPDSPLSENTLSSLMTTFQQLDGASDALRDMDPADMATVVPALQGASELSQFVAAVLVERRVESGNEAQRTELVRLGVVQKLLTVMQRSRQPLLRATVATAFRHLARDLAMRQHLAAAGAVPALSLLLQSPSGAARQASARAISNLVVNSEANKIEVAKFGAIHSLARMLGETDSPAAQEAAAAALANLAANSGEAQSLIASAGAIPLLVEVVRGGTLVAKQHAARAIRNLAGRDTQNKLKAAEAGAIPLLVGLMAGGVINGADSTLSLCLNVDDASRQAAVSALSNIACNCEATQAQIVAEGALPLLCDMLAPASGLATPCREAAAWLLSNLACSAEVRVQLGKDTALLSSVVAGLMQLLNCGSDGAAQSAARAIKNLSAGHSNSNKVVIANSGAIPLLVPLLRSPKDATRKAAASALWNLAYRCNPNRMAIVRAGAIPLLVHLLRPGNSEGCRQEAARALSNLSCNNDVNQGAQMVAEGAVPLLVSMMQSAGPAGKEAAVGAISNLACIRAHQHVILDSGAAPLLLQLMQEGASSGCQEAAARGFGNLVCDSLSDTLRPVAYQAVPLLVRIMGQTGGSDGARQAAARAISNLVCSDVTLQVMVAKSGAPAALVQLCQSPGEEVREAAAVALWDLAYDCCLGREAIARAGAVPWLAQLLLFGRSGAKEAAAACLAELAAVGPAVQQQIREAGAVQLLQGLRNSAVPEVALAAKEALRSLEVNSATSSHAASSSLGTAASASLGQAAPAQGGASSFTPAPALASAATSAAAGGAAGGGGAAGARAFSQSGSWGRRGSQTIQLEQDPPEVAAAAAAAAAVTATTLSPRLTAAPPRAPPAGTPPRLPPVMRAAQGQGQAQGGAWSAFAAAAAAEVAATVLSPRLTAAAGAP